MMTSESLITRMSLHRNMNAAQRAVFIPEKMEEKMQNNLTIRKLLANVFLKTGSTIKG